MAIFIRELKRNFRSWLIWGVSIAGYVALIMSVYPTMAAQTKDLENFLAAFPEGMIKAFSLDRLSMNSVLGFYSTEGITLILMATSIYAVMLVSGIVAKEESDKTIEFLLAKPITRTEIVHQKLDAALIYIIGLNVVQTIAAYVAFEAIKGDYDLKSFLMLALGGLLVNLTFAGIGLLISVFVTKIKSLFPLSLGVAIGAYILSITSKLTSKLDFLKWFTPFSYADPADLVIKQSIAPVHWVLFGVLVVGSIAAAYVFYNRKDITV